jgi:homogentisate 1,2-dioxygenase
MSEFMGNIAGEYDAKPSGFPPGAMSLHSTMSAHGPSQEAYDKAIDDSKPLKPAYIGKGGMAFMFETCYLMKISEYAADKKN